MESRQNNTTSNFPSDGSWDIPLNEFEKIVFSGSSLVIDVREPEEVTVVRVDAKNYLNISVKKFEEALQMDKDTFELTFNLPKPSPDEELAFICRSGRRSKTAIAIARANNYMKTRHYNEGTNGWLKHNPQRVVRLQEKQS